MAVTRSIMGRRAPPEAVVLRGLPRGKRSGSDANGGSATAPTRARSFGVAAAATAERTRNNDEVPSGTSRRTVLEGLQFDHSNDLRLR